MRIDALRTAALGFAPVAGAGGVLLLAAALHLLTPAPPRDPAASRAPIRVALAPRRTLDPLPEERPLPAPPRPAARPRPRADDAAPPRPPRPAPPVPALAWAPMPAADLVLPLPMDAGLLPAAAAGGEGEEAGGEAVEAAMPVVGETFRWLYGPSQMSDQQKARFYPRQALRRGIGGMTVLEVVVGPQGNVLAARVLESDPPALFDRAAQELVRTWRGSGAIRKQVKITWDPGEMAW